MKKIRLQIRLKFDASNLTSQLTGWAFGCLTPSSGIPGAMSTKVVLQDHLIYTKRPRLSPCPALFLAWQQSRRWQGWNADMSHGFAEPRARVPSTEGGARLGKRLMDCCTSLGAEMN